MKQMRADYVPSVYDVFYKNEYVTTLNPRLMESQKATGNLDLIKDLHVQRLALEDLMKNLNPKTQQKVLKEAAKEWEDNQRALQNAWHFPQNDNYIRFWDVPHCACPKMDNSVFE